MRLVYQLYKQGKVTEDDIYEAMAEYMNMEERIESMNEYLGMNTEEYKTWITEGIL